MVELLNQHLADGLDLGLQAKQAHWNVKGPHFIALHELFDKVAEALEEFADEIAARAVALLQISSDRAPWWTSMPRPLAVGRPIDAAWRSNGVCGGL